MRAMSEVLLVSKPVSPPWNDSSKNLVRDLASHLRKHVGVVLSRAGAPELPGARAVPLYPAHAGGYAPALRDNARVLAHLLLGARQPLWHFFFAPNPRSSGVAKLAAGIRRRPTVQTVCSAPREDADLRQVLFADRVVVLSRHTEARFLRAGIDPQRLRRIAPCIAPLAPPSPDERRAWRAQFELPEARTVVVYPGDLEFSRGAVLSLEAQARLPAETRPVLVMACRAKTPAAAEAQAELVRRSAALGIADSVRWIGETPHIHRLLASADVVSLPAEALYAKMDLPLVAIEAMALGRPVLLARGSAADELAEHGGALAVAPEAEAITSQLARWLADPAERAALGAAAVAEVARAYAPAAMAAAYEALYDELLR
jgi:glycosyltransferase involved in cell wall biosynthesis